MNKEFDCFNENKLLNTIYEKYNFDLRYHLSIYAKTQKDREEIIQKFIKDHKIRCKPQEASRSWFTKTKRIPTSKITPMNGGKKKKKKRKYTYKKPKN